MKALDFVLLLPLNLLNISDNMSLCLKNYYIRKSKNDLLKITTRLLEPICYQKILYSKTPA